MEESPNAVVPERKTGSEAFHQGGQPLGFDVLSFWQWSASDLLSNAMHGILAEYLVARALNAATGVRDGWSAHDITTASGLRIEVKSAAYLQSWHQKRLSRITFGTRPTLAWNAETNLLATERKRQADIYVFCLLAHKDKATVDPLDLDQWRFFVIAAARLSAAIGEQKSVGLPRLLAAGAADVRYEQLAEVVQQLARTC